MNAKQNNKTRYVAATLLLFGLSLNVPLYGENCAQGNDTSSEDAPCADKNVDSASQLPKPAQSEVKALHARMRYFTAIGFHDKSKEKRNAIAAIYREHGIDVPKEFQDSQ